MKQFILYLKIERFLGKHGVEVTEVQIFFFFFFYCFTINTINKNR